MKTPTLGQARRLRALADGYAVLAPRRGDWVGLLRKGWVERIDSTTPRGGLLPPLRITDAGREALASTEPQENTCSATTSAPTSLSAVGSGEPLRSLPSLGWAKPLPTLATTPQSCSFASTTPRPIRQPTPLVAREDVFDDLRDIYESLADRALMRERGGYNAGYRCWSCRRFVSGPQATCGHCGQRHGGINHNAYASR